MFTTSSLPVVTQNYACHCGADPSTIAKWPFAAKDTIVSISDCVKTSAKGRLLRLISYWCDSSTIWFCVRLRTTRFGSFTSLEIWACLKRILKETKKNACFTSLEIWACLKRTLAGCGRAARFTSLEIWACLKPQEYLESWYLLSVVCLSFYAVKRTIAVQARAQ